MATRHKSRKHHRPSHLTPKEATALSAEEYHVPFWLLWGIAGAESTWGKGGSNLFGLLDAAEGANISNWRSASKQAAKTLRGLKNQYGTWAAAVEHYSGNSYTIAHPAAIAKESGVGKHVTSRTILATNHIGPIPFEPPEDLFPGPNGMPIPLPNIPGIEGLPGGGSLFSLPGEIVDAFNQFTKLVKLLTDPKFWIRAAEIIGGLILLYIALRSLTGYGVEDVPGTKYFKATVKDAALAASVK